MESFVRTAAYLLAGLCLLLIAAGVTALVMLKGKGIVGPEQFRDLVLTKEERAWLAEMASRPDEPAERQRPEAPVPGIVSEDEVVERIARRVNVDRANEILEEMRRDRAGLDERQAWIERQNAELALARADLQRLKRQVEERDEQLREQSRTLEAERTKWALSQADAVKRTEALSALERDRYREQARIYEQMKDAAWQSLRRFEPKEIARYLKLMDGKKAAKMLTLAEQDKELPGLATSIQKAMLTIDLDEKTDDLVAHLAGLYSYMKGEQVVAYLKDSSPAEIVRILGAMTGVQKKQAEILEALRKADPERSAEVERLMPKTPAPAAGAAS
jgi:hypothetical protein